MLSFDHSSLLNGWFPWKELYSLSNVFIAGQDRVSSPWKQKENRNYIRKYNNWDSIYSIGKHFSTFEKSEKHQDSVSPLPPRHCVSIPCRNVCELPSIYLWQQPPGILFILKWKLRFSKLHCHAADVYRPSRNQCIEPIQSEISFATRSQCNHKYLFLHLGLVDNAIVLIIFISTGVCSMSIDLANKAVNHGWRQVPFQLVNYVVLTLTVLMSWWQAVWCFRVEYLKPISNKR